MPWRSERMIDQRAEFVLRAKRKEMSVRALCAEYGITTKTGYKWLNRYAAQGFDGLYELSRRPASHKAQLEERVVCELVRLKHAHPSWGPRKVGELYRRIHGSAPSESSVKRVLERAGLVARRRRRSVAADQRLIRPEVSVEPNHIWTVDFKGWWIMPGSGRCEPLTIRDDYSRYLLEIRALTTKTSAVVRSAFERVFGEYGLPRIIRSDNGTPFACSRAPLGLSRLSAWWLSLGISLDRIRPGHPEENGGHERMHLDMRRELQQRITGGVAEHQAAFDIWRQEFNWERPHEALSMRTPGEVYRRSARGLEEASTLIDYPFGWLPRRVSGSGTIRIGKRQLFVSGSLSGWVVGLEPLGSGRFALWFDRLLLGEIDQPAEVIHWAEASQ